MFPPNYLDAVKLALLNEPVYHGKQTVEAVLQKLQKDGEFLLQDGDSANTIILSVFKEVVRDFLITIEQVGDSHRFVVGTQRFESISEMLSELKSVRSGSETLELDTAMCRNDGRTTLFILIPQIFYKQFESCVH
ncbi:unnamed protein product [Cylicostephanus goldi]|uniref:SH2 domain-containing protein n=1 Tax=Cylicostephanus goldi TaxID=71465 RepID=A0A3P6RT77_CYLGO|nr:unnamed protein product [Cylicostephanus goldi]